MNRGYIKLFRKIEDNDFFMDKEPYDKRSAWIDLLLMANHKDGYAFEGMNKIIIKRGQRKTSITKLAERWHWGTRKVSAYLDLLQSEGMIYLEKTNRGVFITIVNYCLYQDFSGKIAEQTAQPTAQPNAEQAQNKQQNRRQSRPHTNNNDKNDIKNEFKNDSKMLKKPAAQRDFCVGGRVYEE